MDNFKIWVEDLPRSTIMKILKRMEEEGIRWWLTGYNPTDHIPNVLAALVVEDGMLSYYGGGADDVDDYEDFMNDEADEVSVDEYLYGVTKESFDREAFLGLISATK